jgi:2-octaprenyl-6-methoxyphenol hydroxylase
MQSSAQSPSLQYTHSPQSLSSRPRVEQHYDITIIGGGIVGLTLACALRHTGMTVAIIEAQTPAQASARQRAYAFSPLSAQIFKDLGLWEAVCDRITPFQRVRMSDANSAQTVNFCVSESPTDAVYYGAEHPVLITALQAATENMPGLTPWYATTLLDIQSTPEAMHLTIEQADRRYTLTTQLLVGADGARSRVRDYAGIGTTGWPYWQSCITTVLEPADSHQNTAYEKFWPSGPFAILPIPGNRCQIVWTASHDEAKAMLALPEAQFMAEVQRRYGSQMGNLKLLKPPLLFPVRLMQSDHYVQARLALVGDAAHCCHPVGGQGLNMGIRDAAALAEVLRQAHARGESLGSLQVLKRYERWRRPENWMILALTDVLNRAFSNQWVPLMGLRRLGLWLIDHITPLKRLVLRLMTGFFGKLPLQKG